MSVIEIVSLIVFVLAGALFGYKAWVAKEPIPPVMAVEEHVEEPSPDPSVVPPVEEK